MQDCKLMRYAAFDANTSEIVVALSNIDKTHSADNIPAGDLIRAVSIKHVNQTIFKHPAMQLLVHESHSIFSRAQRDAKVFTLTVSDVLSYSLQYRSIIRSTLSTIPVSEYEIKESLTTAELIWSLVEAIFIKTHDSSIVVDLMSWARLCLAHTPYVDEISKVLRGSKIKRLNKQHFWQQIIYFVLSGMFNNAATFLETYGNLCDDVAVRCLAKVLSEIKMNVLNDENTALDFITTQEEVRNMCTRGLFRTNAEAEKVAMIIAGDIPTITMVSAQLDNWFELVPPYLLFIRPCATLPQLKDAVKECLKIFGIDKCDGIDAVMCELFSLEALRALHRISTSSTNWWFPAHLADLLQKADERIISAYDMDVRQYLVIEYGSSLFSEPGLWQVGFDYLRETGNEGLSHLELLIAQVPLDNETVATKLCSLCDEVDFDQTRKDIARAMAYKLLRTGRWGSALSWAIRSRDIEIVSTVADQVISRCSPDQFSSITVVEHFTEVMLLSSSFIFLHRYYKFRKLLDSDQKVKAAELLVELIVSDLVPREFDVILLSDLISILSEEDEVIISKDGSEQLLEHLVKYEADGPFQHNYDEWKMRLRTCDSMLSGLSKQRSLSSVTPAMLIGNSRLDPLSLGMMGMDNREAVIIDIGAVLTKVGYAGEFVPRAIIRTELLDDCRGETVKVFDDTISEEELYRRLVKFFRELFFKYLLTVAKDRRIVIVESILARTSHRNAVARVLFDAFDAPSVLFAPSHLLATFSFGVSNALVIDVGYSEATVVPILESVTMLYQLETSCIGAKYLEERVYELLRKYGKVLTFSGAERALTDSDDLLIKKEHILEDIVVRFCFATKIDRGKMIQASEYNPEREIPKAPCDVRLPFGEEMLIVPGLIREWTAEAIFEENDDIRSLPQLVLDAVYRCPIDTRRKLLDSIILVGGTTRMKGFYARLRDEILHLLTAPAYAQKLGNIKSVKFYRLPNTSIELYASWIGGSMFGALDVLQYHSMTRQDWKAQGKVPDWTSNVYEMNRDPARSR